MAELNPQKQKQKRKAGRLFFAWIVFLKGPLQPTCHYFGEVF
jgi:hypothetical protein